MFVCVVIEMLFSPSIQSSMSIYNLRLPIYKIIKKINQLYSFLPFSFCFLHLDRLMC